MKANHLPPALFCFLLGAVLTACAPTVADEAAGLPATCHTCSINLDSTFNGTGFVVFRDAAGSGGDDDGRAVAVDSGGNVVVTGLSYSDATDTAMVVYRYLSDGSLDTSFNSTGFLVRNNIGGGNNADWGSDIMVDQAGNYLVTGATSSTNSGPGTNLDMFAMRIKQGGALDTTFDGDGIMRHHGAAGIWNDRGVAITTDSSGRLLIAGMSDETSAAEFDIMALWRIDTDGSLDTTFNSVGFLTRADPVGSESIPGQDIAIDSQGRILVIGYSGYSSDLVIWRFNSHGTRDTTFDSDGIVTFSQSSGWVSGIAIDSSDRIVASGAAGSDMGLWRFNSDGSLDTTFGGVGYVTHCCAAGGSTGGGATQVIIESSGKIVAGGSAPNESGDADIVVWRYNTEGTLDTTFDRGGYSVVGNLAGGSGTDSATGLAIDTSGRYVLSGSSFNGTDNDMVIVRFVP